MFNVKGNVMYEAMLYTVNVFVLFPENTFKMKTK